MSISLNLFVTDIFELACKLLNGLLMQWELGALQELPFWFSSNRIVMMILIDFRVHVEGDLGKI